MSLDFFEQFATIDIGVKTEQKNVEKIQKNVSKKYKFIHGKSVLMLCGQYKGYTGFVYEYFPKTVSFALNEEQYVMAHDYPTKVIGDEIMTVYGLAKIVSRVEQLYNVKLYDQDEMVRLPRNYFIQFVFFMEGGFVKVGKVTNQKYNEYEFERVIFDYSSKDSKESLMNKLSNMYISGNLNGLYGNGKKEKIHIIDCFDVIYMVNKRPQNKNDNDYYGKYGKLVNKIPEQFLVLVKRVIRLNESMCKLDGNNVKVKSGLYKNKEGEFVSMDDAYLSVNIESIGKMICNHLIFCGNGMCRLEKILPSHVFYMDLQLKNGNYYQVIDFDGVEFNGVEKVGNTFVESKVKNSQVRNFMCGFTFIQNVENFIIEENENEQLSIILEDDKENPTEVFDIENDDDSKDDIDYNMDVENVVENVDDNYVYEDNQNEMKQSFKDTERASFIERSFSKNEKEYLKIIDKCVDICNVDIHDKYTILDIISDSVKNLKNELQKENITEWKNTDIKYIIVCVIFREIQKKNGSITVYKFRNYITKLYNSNFFTKDTIMGSIFLYENENIDNDSTLYVLKLSPENRITLKNNYKNKKFDDIIKYMMERCFDLLNSWYEIISFSTSNTKIEWIPIAKPNTVRHYPKYFLTTSDIVNNVQSQDATKIIWSPESQKLINMWKISLDEKLNREDNDVVKKIYEFVKNNIENAPFVLKQLEYSDNKLDKLKYRELKRTFETFSSKLKSFVVKKQNEKQIMLDRHRYEKAMLNQRREFIVKNGRQIKEI